MGFEIGRYECDLSFLSSGFVRVMREFSLLEALILVLFFEDFLLLILEDARRDRGVVFKGRI